MKIETTSGNLVLIDSTSSFNFLFIQMCFIRSPADLPPIINFFHSPHTHFLCLYEIFMIKNCKLARLFYEWPKDTKTIINHNYILLLTLLLPIKMQLYSIVVVSIRITYHQTVQVGRGCNIATAATHWYYSCQTIYSVFHQSFWNTHRKSWLFCRFNTLPNNLHWLITSSKQT